jgi:hypothetical protein
MGDSQPSREHIEQWFIARGLPHLIEKYRANVDVWTRTYRTLVAIAAVSAGANAFNRRWSSVANVAVVVATVAGVVLIAAAMNHKMGGGWKHTPARVSTVVLGVLVACAAIPSLIFGYQWRLAIITAVAGVAVLGATYLVTSYGLVPMTRWALGRVITQVTELGSLIARALPLLLLIVIVLFINTEMWQVVEALNAIRLTITAFTLFAVGAFFVVGRLPIDVAEIGHFDSWHQCADLAQSAHPELGLTGQLGDESLEVALTRRQWLNVGLVLLFSQAVIVTIVGIVTFVFFMVFGAVAIQTDVIETWTGAVPHHLGPTSLGITEELVKASAFLGAFSSLYFTVYLVTDETYRREFRSSIVKEVRTALAVCALYRHHTGATTSTV